jgi:ArsR family transcriptional regulator, arsenate/arsenite/antimonite-responsive transcriptional repressor
MSKYRVLSNAQYADIFKALSNPHRLKIFMRLAGCGPDSGLCCTDDTARECVGDLGCNLGIAPSTVSHHLKELYRAGLIKTSRQGQRIECHIDPATLEALVQFFNPAVEKQ